MWLSTKSGNPTIDAECYTILQPGPLLQLIKIHYADLMMTKDTSIGCSIQYKSGDCAVQSRQVMLRCWSEALKCAQCRSALLYIKMKLGSCCLVRRMTRGIIGVALVRVHTLPGWTAYVLYPIEWPDLDPDLSQNLIGLFLSPNQPHHIVLS